MTQREILSQLGTNNIAGFSAETSQAFKVAGNKNRTPFKMLGFSTRRTFCTRNKNCTINVANKLYACLVIDDP